MQKNRPLTPQEIQLAHEVFADALNCQNIRIKTAWWVLKGYAISPNGNIYFHKDDYLDDFATANLRIRSWFVHELVHVWQIQQGINVFWRALFNRKYRYRIQKGRSFFDYGVEQQAQMVQDFYILKQTNQDCRAHKACIAFLSKT